MRKTAFLLILFTLGCATNKVGWEVQVAYNTVVAAQSLSAIQTGTIRLHAAKVLSTAQAIPVMDGIKVANNTLKLISLSLQTYSESKSNASTVQALLNIFARDIKALESMYPPSIKDQQVIQAFLSIIEWTNLILGGVK